MRRRRARTPLFHLVSDSEGISWVITSMVERFMRSFVRRLKGRGMVLTTADMAWDVSLYCGAVVVRTSADEKTATQSCVVTSVSAASLPLTPLRMLFEDSPYTTHRQLCASHSDQARYSTTGSKHTPSLVRTEYRRANWTSSLVYSGLLPSHQSLHPF